MLSSVLCSSPLSLSLRSSINQGSFFFHNNKSSSSSSVISDNSYGKSGRGKLILWTTIAFSGRNSGKFTILDAYASNIVDENERIPEVFLNLVEGSESLSNKEGEKDNRASVKETGRLPTALEEGKAGLVESNGGISTKKEVNFIDLVEKSGGFRSEGEIENLNFFVQRISKQRVHDLLERTGKLPNHEQTKILDIFEKDRGILTLTDFNNLLVALVKSNELDFAVNLFGELPSHGLVADSHVSATLSLSSIPRTSPSISFASCNSAFFRSGGIDVLKKKNKSNCLVLSRSRARRGLNCRCLFGLGVPELAVIAGVAALVFGPKKLPEVGRSIGKTVKSFQQAAKEFESELKKEPERITENPEEKPTTDGAEEKQDAKVSSSKESL